MYGTRISFSAGANTCTSTQLRRSSETRITMKRRGLQGIIGCRCGLAPRPSGAGVTRQPGLSFSAGGGGGVRVSGERSAMPQS